MERPSKKETTFVTSAQERLSNKKKKKHMVCKKIVN